MRSRRWATQTLGSVNTSGGVPFRTRCCVPRAAAPSIVLTSRNSSNAWESGNFTERAALNRAEFKIATGGSVQPRLDSRLNVGGYSCASLLTAREAVSGTPSLQVGRRQEAIDGRLAAAMAWPWRLSCSLGT